ncbi:serine hydrolase-like protein isoform X2 [Leguminivora glycinivorella]|uniref:serine hydrolase-like protein isoform X2 n=1 Tax=Leguminivora glycinivorella TaxID=1035111 RepID=UPI00200EA12E|nr:serine hydrolase-like protein isoform X2 [Leguminivora glycinivorella]
MPEIVMKEWFLNVPWGKLAMLSWGDPFLPPTLLVHGFMDTAATFIPLVNAMPATYHYVTFDLPGCGHSDTIPGPPLSPLHFAETIRQVVEQQGWDTFYCIAHSMGYLISAYYNAAHPGRIRRLVSLAGAIGIQIHGLAELPKHWFDVSIDSYYRRYFHQPPPPLSYKKAIQSLAKARDVSEEDAAILASRCLESVNGNCRFTWDIKAKKLYVPPIAPDTLYSILSTPTPTLCLVPTEDNTPITFEDYHVTMLERLTNERFVLVSVPGGHSVHLTNPEVVVPKIVKFFEEDVRAKL